MKTISDMAHEIAKDWAKRRTDVEDPDYEVSLNALLRALDEYQESVEERMAALEKK